MKTLSTLSLFAVLGGTVLFATDVCAYTCDYVGGLAGCSNTASADNATVSGGQSNAASGIGSTVCGGSSNTVSGNNAVVGGWL
jgi:hypothetical protein